VRRGLPQQRRPGAQHSARAHLVREPLRRLHKGVTLVLVWLLTV
jgi:hypothetical protein